MGDDDDSPGAFVLFVLVVGGLATMGFTGCVIYDERQTIAEAEPVDAEILDTEVVEREGGTNNEDRESYVPRVSYRYDYDGETYTTDQVFPGGNVGMDRGAANDVVDRYEEGDTVTAHVDPKNPEESFLETSSRFSLGMGAFALLGLVMFVAGVDRTVNAIVDVSVLGKVRESM